MREIEIENLPNVGMVHIKQIDPLNGSVIGITSVPIQEWNDKRKEIVESYALTSVKQWKDLLIAAMILLEE